MALIICPGYCVVKAQSCPANIDFESGTFDGWQCYIGIAEALNGENIIDLSPSSTPVLNRQTMYTANSGNGVDPYGGFPVNCPNGSGHSIRLGNNQAGTQAEGLSYQFSIPPNKNVYALVYHYAVVFQDPNHEKFEQPRLEIEVTDVSDNKAIQCSSFTFIPYGSLLPGFFESPNPDGDTPVWCKDWSAVSVNLDGMAGKTIRLFFKTADCTFRKHFGYAYLDVDSQCSSEFIGSTYCRDDTTVNLVAPFGYQYYTWFDTTFTRVLGTRQTIAFKPPPPAGTIYPVIVTPYSGYGCVDTFYARLKDNLLVKADAGKDTLSCDRIPVGIGANAIPGLVYSWQPGVGLSDPNAANPAANPPGSTTYILTENSAGGGCLSSDTVLVRTSTIDTALRLTGRAMFCSDSGDSALLHVTPTKSILWYQDSSLINDVTGINYKVKETGRYLAVLTNNDGCVLRSQSQYIVVDNPTPAIRYPDAYAIGNLPLNLQARQFGDEVVWSPGISLNTVTSYTPVFSGRFEQLYTIKIVTKGGCVTVDTQLVKAIDKVAMYVPNAFTPNGDGLNDVLRPVLFGIKELHYFKIFNRLGQQLFQTNVAGKGWDGTLNGLPQFSQVVVWIAEGVGVDDKTYLLKGSSILLR
ncbi:MAG: T9SS type B sorting domain-containing protein [Ginsengibacter sp.]